MSWGTLYTETLYTEITCLWGPCTQRSPVSGDPVHRDHLFLGTLYTEITCLRVSCTQRSPVSGDPVHKDHLSLGTLYTSITCLWGTLYTEINTDHLSLGDPVQTLMLMLTEAAERLICFTCFKQCKAACIMYSTGTNRKTSQSSCLLTGYKFSKLTRNCTCGVEHT